MKNKLLNTPANIDTTDTMTYIDTVEVWLSDSLDINQQRYIQPDPKKMVYDSHAMDVYYRPGYLVKLSLHQPTEDVLERLLEKAPDCKLTSAHFAYDELFATQHEADYQRDLHEQHLTKKRHGKQTLTNYKGTLYYCNKKAGMNLVIYSSKPSRFTKQPCCHTEARLKKTALKSLGVHGVEDLIEFNQYATVFDKLTVAYAITARTYIRIGKVRLGCTRQRDRIHRYRLLNKTFEYNYYQRIGVMFVRSKLLNNELMTVQQLIDFMKPLDKRFKDYLVRL